MRARIRDLSLPALLPPGTSRPDRPRCRSPLHPPAYAFLVLALALGGCRDDPTGPEAGPLDTEPRTTFGTALDEEAMAIAAGSWGIFVVGWTAGDLDGPNRGGADAFVRRYHPEGDLLWADQFGSNVNDAALGVAVDAAGNAYVVGRTDGSIAGSRGGVDAWVRKYDVGGAVVWTRQFGTPGHDIGNAIAVDGSGTVFVAGRTFGALRGAHQGYGDAFVRAYSPEGDEVWTRQFGTPDGEYASGVAVDQAGGVFVVGWTWGTLQGTAAGGNDAFIRKYTAAGGHAWTRQFGTAGNDEAYSVAVDGSGRAIVVGETTGSLGGPLAGGWDAFVRKYNSDGSVAATRQFGTSSNDYARSVAVAGNQYFVGGRTSGGLGQPNAGGWDAFVRRYNGKDEHVWTAQFGTAANDRINAVAALSTSAVFAAGNTGSSLFLANSGGQDAFLVRLDANGARVWADQ
jgi:hypothetical protein